MTKQLKTQTLPLARPVCGAGCTLLSGHTGKHTAENGKQWR